MAKAEIKTKATDVSVADFIAAGPDARRREEAAIVDAIHRRITGLAPKMSGPSILGYGSYDYVYDTVHSGTMCSAGFSPRHRSGERSVGRWHVGRSAARWWPST